MSSLRFRNKMFTLLISPRDGRLGKLCRVTGTTPGRWKEARERFSPEPLLGCLWGRQSRAGEQFRIG